MLTNLELIGDSNLLFDVEFVYSRGTNFDSPVETFASYDFCTYRAAIGRDLTQVATSSSFGPLILSTTDTVIMVVSTRPLILSSTDTVITVVSTICLLLSTGCIIVIIAQLMTIGVAKIAKEQDFVN
jgi:hypothetical protein